MGRDYSISVAMATYNGEKYIRAQLDSILSQLKNTDEVIISDDGSTDQTLDIIANYNDIRIKVLQGPKMGVKQNFANAIQNCSGKYIFLSDQDDIWVNGKVNTVLSVFEKEKCTVVVHDAVVFSSADGKEILSSFFKFRKSGRGILKNIFKNTYIGCCMAIDSSMKDKILPIPNHIEMHDQWIGIKSEIYGKSKFISDKLIKYRRHEKNASSLDKHHSFWKMFKNRVALIKELLKG